MAESRLNLCALAELFQFTPSSTAHVPFFPPTVLRKSNAISQHPGVNPRSAEVYKFTEANSPIATHYCLQSCVLLAFLVLSHAQGERHLAIAFKQTGITEVAHPAWLFKNQSENQCSGGVTQELVLPSRLMDVRCVFV